MAMSLVLPAESRSTLGLPKASATPCSFEVQPPRDRPMPCAKAPFCAGRRTVRLDVGGVDRHHPASSMDAGVAGQRLEQPMPDALPRPAVEAVVDGRVGAVDLRAVAPPRSRAQHVRDPRDHPPIIDAMRPFPPPRQKRLDPRPFHIANPIIALGHPAPPSAKQGNHRTQTKGILLSTEPSVRVCSGGRRAWPSDPSARAERR